MQWQALRCLRRAAVVAAEEEKQRKRLERIAVDAAKPKKIRSCGQLGCNINIDVTTNALKKINEATWKKCKGKRCNLWVCPDHFSQIAQHELICVKCSDQLLSYVAKS